MYRIMVVDDEVYVADSMYNFFMDIKHLELDVYKAYSAVEALEWMSRANFDIVVTDIRMPGMNGLDLLAKIKEAWPHCWVMFLTGYDEFEYIYKAIKYEGVSYLLKSESYDKVLETVENIIMALDKTSLNEGMLKKIQQQNEMALPLIQKEYVRNIIKGNNSSCMEKDLISEDIQWPFSLDIPFMLILTHMERSIGRKSFYQQLELYNSMRAVADTILGDAFTFIQVEIEPLYILWLMQPKQNSGVNSEYAEGTGFDEIWGKAAGFIKRAIENIQNICAEKLNISASYAVDTKKGDISSFPQRYDELKELLNSCLFGAPNMRIFYSENMQEVILNSRNVALPNFLLKNQVSKLEKFEHFLENGDSKGMLTFFAEMESLPKDHSSMHYNPTIVFYYRVAFTIYSYINRCSLAELLAFRLPLYKLMNLNEHGSWTEAFEYLKKVSELILELKAQIKSEDQVVTCVKEYINAHFTDNLSLTQIAEAVHYNPSYLSRLFKQQTGLNIFECINHIRLEKAEELLAHTDTKVTEMAGRIGFSSTNYFFQFFRKAKGITPHDYRERYRK